MRRIITGEAAKAPAHERVAIRSENNSSEITLTYDEVERYINETGFDPEDVVPSWMITHILGWCRNPQNNKQPLDSDI